MLECLCTKHEYLEVDNGIFQLMDSFVCLFICFYSVQLMRAELFRVVLLQHRDAANGELGL